MEVCNVCKRTSEGYSFGCKACVQRATTNSNESRIKKLEAKLDAIIEHFGIDIELQSGYKVTDRTDD